MSFRKQWQDRSFFSEKDRSFLSGDFVEEEGRNGEEEGVSYLLNCRVPVL